MPASPSTRLGLIGPLGADPIASGDDIIRAIIAALDPIAAIWTTGTLAARPAASIVGRFYKASDNTGLYLDLGSSWLTIVAPTVSALPGSPVDGDRINFVADATNGVVWPLVYRAADASAYKWNAIGPSEIASEVATQEGANAAITTYQDLATVGPSVTVPLAGDYRLTFGARVQFPTGVNATYNAFMAVKRGASATADIDSDAQTKSTLTSAEASGPAAKLHRNMTMTALTASTVLKAQYRTDAALTGTVLFYSRYLWVKPIRVG